ncbi:MAG TPA: hypothetical protein VFA32_17220 [Dehalococcoidia bacterium]|nr:hypothetical protein [Dehalococcoidia bacterium]
MSQVHELVQQAQELGALFRVEGERVTVGGPSPLPSDLLEKLRDHKAELIEYLSAERRESRSLSDLNLLAWASELAQSGVVLTEPVTFIEAPLRPIRTVRVSHHASIHLRTVAMARTNQITGGWGRFTREWWRGQERAALHALSALREAMEEQHSQDPQS